MQHDVLYATPPVREPKMDRENVLMKAIARRSWDAVVDRARQCPEEAERPELVAVGRGNRRVRLLPTLYACTRNPPCRVLQALISAAPESVLHVDQNGRNLLHWAVDAEACTEGTSPEVIKDILRFCPGSPRQRCVKYGCLPLHVACYHGGRGGRGRSGQNNWRLTAYEQLRIVQLLLGAYPEGALCPDNHRGFLPLHVCCRTGASTEVIKALLEARPAAAGESDNDGRLPIHYATRYSELWNREEIHTILKSLFETFPGGLKMRETKSGFTPLAIACSMPNAPKNTISILLGNCPSAATIPDSNSALPIHGAARMNADCGLIDALLCANAKGAQVCDNDGMLPLHWSCTTGADVRVIENLIRRFPSGTSQKESKRNSTPLHLAVKNSADDDVILLLLNHYPKGARAKDSGGALPIHLACRNGSRVSVRSLKALLIAYPEGLEARDNHGRRPIDYVRMSEDEGVKSAFLKVLTSSTDGDRIS